MSIINKFNIINEIDKQTANRIKLFYATKFHLLFATYDKNVFHYNIKHKQLSKLDSFRENDNIIKFDCCLHETRYMALTDSGSVYCCDFSDYYLFGDETINNNKPILVNSLREHNIIDISCGFITSLVLTGDGDVYAFGNNMFGQCGNNSTDDQLTPIKVNLPNTATVCGIWSGEGHSIALTQFGHVFGWGSNSHNQLGIDGSIKIQLTAIQLSVPSIKQVMVSHSFTLMLSYDGDIYCCGQIKDCVSHRSPTKLNHSSTKFIKIGATNHSRLCVALSDDRKCFIFGTYRDEYPPEVPLKDLVPTSFVSVSETFAHFEQITYKCVKIIQDVSKNTIFENGFKELSLISSGGFSSVFQCEHRLTHKLYAIKKISFEPQNYERVLKELKFLSDLESNFVVKYIHSWIEDNYYLSANSSNSKDKNMNQLVYSPLRTQLLHIQMELCSLTLREVIVIVNKECKTLTNTLSLIHYYISSELLFEILECLQYLHQLNPAIIHRDLKPANILINFINNRFVKLSDFGLSTSHEFSDQSHTKYLGTKRYKAPDVNLTTKYTTKVDIYSLGVIILELFDIDISKQIEDTVLPLKSINDMALSALNVIPESRPECETILSQQSVWRLSREQLSLNEDFNEIVGKNPKSKSLEENFIEFFVQNKFEFNNTININ